MEIDHDGAKTCARSTKIFSNTPLIFQIDLELSELPRNYELRSYQTDGQTQIEIRLYIVPRCASTEIEDLKQGQQSNEEAIQALSDTISHMGALFRDFRSLWTKIIRVLARKIRPICRIQKFTCWTCK